MDTQNLNNDLKEILNQIIMMTSSNSSSFYFTKEDVFVICQDGQSMVCEPEFSFRIHSPNIENIADTIALYAETFTNHSIITADSDDDTLLVLIFEKQSDPEEVTTE